MANTKITSRVLADNAVLTANITDANVTTAKVADNAVTGDKVADDVALAGNPTTTTQSAGNNTTRIATTAFVSTAVADLADSAPDALNTLNELAAALGDDANFSTTITNSIAAKLPLAGGTMTGTIAGFTSTGIDDNADATAITIGSDESVDFAKGVVVLGSGTTSGVYLNGTNSDSIAQGNFVRYGTNFLTQSDAANDDLITYAFNGSTFINALNIKSNGNVGIGTTSPNGRLEIREGASDFDPESHIIISNDDIADGDLMGILFKQRNENDGKAWFGTERMGDYGVSDFVFLTDSVGDDNAVAATDEKMRITYNGNVGIGTSLPNSKTHIVGAANAIALRVTNAAVDGNTADVVHIEPSNGAYYGKLLRIQSGRSDFSDSLLFLNTTATINGTNGSYMRVQNSSGADIFRIKGDGNVGIGNASPARELMVNGQIEAHDGSGSSRVMLRYQADGEGFSTANSAMLVAKNTGTSRSINCGGTVNASGADYAEYMKKSDSCGTIAKGDVAGVDSDGKLTKTYSAAKSFVIKSTNPSYVGGDTWGNADLELTEEQTEIERQKYDRIAFSGQVPVNITGSFNVGDYVYPQKNGTGIQAVAKSTPTFEEYQLCVGKIWTTMDDGRPLVAVKIG